MAAHISVRSQTPRAERPITSEAQSAFAALGNEKKAAEAHRLIAGLRISRGELSEVVSSSKAAQKAGASARGSQMSSRAAPMAIEVGHTWGE